MTTVTDIQDFVDENGNVIVGNPRACVNSFIEFAARNCRVEISDGVSFHNAKIKMTADNGVLRIGERSSVKNAIRVGLDSSVIIGKRLSCTGGGIVSAAEGTSVTIGDDCMFGVSCDIRSDHAHPIFDRSTGERVNKSKPLVIGNHVWLGPHALIYPGANVGDGSVIGARSLVSGTIPPNCIAVGVPARVTRRNIVWDKTHVGSKAPWQFNDVQDLARSPWQSAVGNEPPPRRRTWWKGIFVSAGCAAIAALPVVAGMRARGHHESTTIVLTVPSPNLTFRSPSVEWTKMDAWPTMATGSGTPSVRNMTAQASDVSAASQSELLVSRHHD